MTTALPNGLVSHTDRASSELRRFDSVDTEDIAKLWRVYTTNTTTLKEDTGRRLENLFWRIWSNNQICAGIRGSTIARLLLHISEGLPVGTDWTSETRSKSGRRKGNDADADNNASTVQNGFGNFSFEKRSIPLSSSRSPPSPGHAGGISPRNTSLSQRGKHALLPPPILKKPRESFKGQQQDERALMPGTSGPANSLQKGTFGDRSTPDTSPRAASNSSNSPGRKRTTFAKNLVSTINNNQTGLRELAPDTTVNGAKGQTQVDVRPVTQTDTTQSRKGKTPNRQQLFDSSPRNQQTLVPSPPAPLRSPTSSTSSSQTLANNSPKQHNNAVLSNPSGPALVDKDFRSKFVAKQRISGSSTLAGFGLGTSTIPSYSNTQDTSDLNAHTLRSTSQQPPAPAPSTFQLPPPLARRTSSPGSQNNQSYRPGARSPFQSSSFLRSTPLSRSSSVQTVSRRPVQSQLSRLLELEREREGGEDK